MQVSNPAASNSGNDQNQYQNQNEPMTDKLESVVAELVEARLYRLLSSMTGGDGSTQYNHDHIENEVREKVRSIVKEEVEKRSDKIRKLVEEKLEQSVNKQTDKIQVHISFNNY